MLAQQKQELIKESFRMDLPGYGQAETLCRKYNELTVSAREYDGSHIQFAE